MGLFSSIGKVFGKVADVVTSPLGGLASSALGTLWQNDQAKDAASTQMQFQADMSNSAYQRAMEDMRKAGLNPILAGKVGGASTPTGAMYNPQNVGSSALSGTVKSQTARNLVEQNNNLQANSALQRTQAEQAAQQVLQTSQQTRRLQLENDAYATLSPEVRAMVLSGSGAGSLAGAGQILGRSLRGAGANLAPIARGSANSAKAAWSWVKPSNIVKPFSRFWRKK